MNPANIHRDNMDEIREKLENSIKNSSVDVWFNNGDCFFDVTQTNQETGNKSTWAFCVDFGTGKVIMFEPVEKEDWFENDNEVFEIIKSFLHGGNGHSKKIRSCIDYGNSINNSFNPGDVAMYDDDMGKIKCKIIRKVDKSEVPSWQNSNAGDYYEIQIDSEQIGPSKRIVWENRLSSINSSHKSIKSGKTTEENYKYITAYLYVNPHKELRITLKVPVTKYNEDTVYKFITKEGSLITPIEEITEEEYLKYRPKYIEHDKWLYLNPKVDWLDEYYTQTVSYDDED